MSSRPRSSRRRACAARARPTRRSVDRLAERDVEVAREAGVDRGFGHRVLLHRGRRASPDTARRSACRCASTSIVPRVARVVGPFDVAHAVEAERVSRRARSVSPGSMRRSLLDAVAFRPSSRRRRTPRCPDARAPCRSSCARSDAELRAQRRAGASRAAVRTGPSTSSPRSRPRAAGPRCTPHDQCPSTAGRISATSTLTAAAQRSRTASSGSVALFQRASGPTPMQEQRRHHQRHEHGLEVRRADRDLAHAERVERERIQRAEQHRAGGDDEHDVVREQHRLARDGSNAPPSPTRGARSANSEQRAADHDRRGRPG